MNETTTRKFAYHRKRSRARWVKRKTGRRYQGDEWKRKRGLKWLQLRGFSSRPGSRKEFMKGKSFPSTVRSPCGGAPEVSLMLRYFTRKLFKSNILPAVIKYKLHRGVARALKYSPSARVRVTDISRTKLDNKSPFAGMKSFDSFVNEAKASLLRQYFYSEQIYRKKMFVDLIFPPSLSARSQITRTTFCEGGNISLINWSLSMNIDWSWNGRFATLHFTLFQLCQNFQLKREKTSFILHETAPAQPLPPRLSRSLRKSRHVGYEVRCATRYLVGIYVCHDSLLLGSQLIRIRLESTTGNSWELSLKHTALLSFKFSALNSGASLLSDKRDRKSVV